MSLLSQLNWRYAVKHMNGKKLPDDKLEYILNAIQLAPSSLGLQPYKIWVIGDEKMRIKIHEKACTQPQVIEGSHLLVFAARESTTVSDTEDFVELVSSVRNTSRDSVDRLRKRINIFAESKQKSPGQFFNWASRQTYIALGFGLAAAAEKEVDATPMEGFDQPVMDDLLGFKDMGLRSVVLMMLGYRDAENDPLAAAKKVRKPAEKLFVRI